jgi:superfamily II DNA/RNA helicase
MPQFEVNQRVSLQSNPENKGVIHYVLSQQGGHQFYDVLWDAGHTSVIPEYELIKEIRVETAWDLLANNALKNNLDFSVASTLSKVRNKTSNTISTLKASRTMFLPYQFIPLLKFLRSDLKRILIADEVGLGKTIEAGHILLEMAARGNLRNALVICTNALRDKWKSELIHKFNFNFKKYETTREFIHDIEDDIESGQRSITGIVNYAKCRNQNLQDLIGESGYGFDLVICDEAHAIRNQATQQHKGVANIINYSGAVVLLTATPIMTELSNLQNLLRVLDEDAYGTKDIFFNAVNQNRPFIRALRKLDKRADLLEIAEELHSSQITQQMTVREETFDQKISVVGDLFANDELYQRVREKLLTNDNSSRNLVQIQNDLIDLNSLNHIYSRTKRANVFTDRVLRQARTLTVHLTEEEQYLYDEVMDMYDESQHLALMTKKRQISSCIPVFGTNRQDLKMGRFDRDIPDSKYRVFQNVVDEVVHENNNKLIVFAFFTNTLLYLKHKLEEQGLRVAIIYGGVDDRTEVIESFRDDPSINVLLSSEVGSEGLDLQFCNALVNYDLPWNPMKVEQRIGRIDRVGQQAEVINIYNLILANTIEEQIHERLYQRIRLFEETLGDLEEILGDKEGMGDHLERSIQKLYSTKMSSDDRKRLLDEIGLAIEHKKEDLNRIREGLSDSFANDIHFQSEVEKIKNNKRYITQKELILYIKSLIRNKLTTLQLIKVKDDVYKLKVPDDSKVDFYYFIESKKDSSFINPELEKLYRNFKLHYDTDTIHLTFDQEFAFKHKNVEYVSAFHPLINAATNFFNENGFDRNQAHKLALNQGQMKGDLEEGFYLLIVFGVTILRDAGDGIKKRSEVIKQMLCDLNGDEPELIDEELAEQVYGVVQEEAEVFEEDIELNQEIVNTIRGVVSIRMWEKEEELRKEDDVRFRSTIERRLNQEIDYTISRLKRVKYQLTYAQGIPEILQKTKSELEQKLEKLQQDKENIQVESAHHLVSLNLLHIYG